MPLTAKAQNNHPIIFTTVCWPKKIQRGGSRLHFLMKKAAKYISLLRAWMEMCVNTWGHFCNRLDLHRAFLSQSSHA